MLKTQRLTLRPVSEHDLNKLHAIFVNPFVRKYLCDNEIFSLQQVKEMLHQSMKHFEEEGFGLWLIELDSVEPQNPKVVGFVGLWYFFDEPQPQLLYALLPKALKQGYASEAANKILAYCFDELGYDYVVASCDRPNLNSQKVAQRLRMHKVEERIIHQNPVVFFRIDQASFRQLHSKP